MSCIPISPYFGRLEINHVYEYYDGPKLFLAENGAGNKYIAFWIDSDQETTTWLYSSISDNRLKSLNNSEIELRDLFIYPEDIVFQVTNSIDGKTESQLRAINDSNLCEDILPPAGFKLNSKNKAPRENFKVSELYIKNHNGKGSPELGKIANLTNSFSKFYSSILKKLEKKNRQIIPLDARPGSFILRLKSPHIDECAPEIKKVFNIINKKENCFEELNKIGADIIAIQHFLEEIAENKLTINFSPKDNFSTELKLTYDTAINVIGSLKEKTTSYISSNQVPQANDLNKIERLLEIKTSGEIPKPEDIELTTDRQLMYYTHAAKTLGLLSTNNSINAASLQFTGLSNQERKRVLSMRFESSDCGWAWLNWARKNTIAELDPDTAFEFLSHACPSLSADTAERRAKTLKKWQKELAPHRS